MAWTLAKFYREYLNDFLTIARFAEYHEISEVEATELVKIGKLYHEAGY